MSDKLIKYTISIYTENSVGLLNRISAIFQRRHINIESFNSSMTEIENVQRWTILVITRESFIKKIVGQINKQVEVIQAYYHRDEETIYQESCLFKIKSSLLFDDRKIQNIIKESNAIIVTVNSEFFVIEKSGRTHELDELYEKLNKYGILQYVRSGRIAVTKSPMMISEKLSNFKKQLR
jgi:acetolactate synthase-1/3 small subunit